MLDVEAGRVSPVVKHLTAVEMPADAPAVCVALVAHHHVAHANVVKVSAFEGNVIEARLGAADDCQRMMVCPGAPLSRCMNAARTSVSPTLWISSDGFMPRFSPYQVMSCCGAVVKIAA